MLADLIGVTFFGGSACCPPLGRACSAIPTSVAMSNQRFRHCHRSPNPKKRSGHEVIAGDRV
jgi:hypothetical protein